MKILNLNQKQQVKLFKLCDEFFPSNFQHFIGLENGNVKLYLPTKEGCEGEYCVDIHWYQLCLTELPERIWSKLNNKFHYDRKLDGDFLENYTDFNIRVSLLMKLNIIDSVHPVDFLYDFVKECKKNKYFKK